MHNLDRTLRIYESETGENAWSSGELELELGEEMETFDHEGPFSESEEMELAAELLSLNDEADLDQFLGKMFKRIGKGFKTVFKPLGKILRPVAKTLLPIAGKVAGSFFGGPVGGMVGGKLGSLASNLFEMELEGMDPGQQEMEVARRFVRFAGSAARNADRASSSAPPWKAARMGVASAARRHAPGLLRGRFGRRLMGRSGNLASISVSEPSFQSQQTCGCHGRSGCWIRRGGKVVLLGI